MSARYNLAALFLSGAMIFASAVILSFASTTHAQSTTCPRITTYLSLGTTHQDVITLKQYLQAEGFLSGTQNTTYFGASTEAALKQWQLKKGIEPTGTAGPKTRAALLNCNSSAPATPSTTNTTTNNNCPLITTTLARGSRHSEVRTLQNYFVSQNLLTPDSATGFFGALTERAVQTFQRANNLEAVGFTGVRTRAALRNCSGSTSVIPPGQIAPPVGIPATTTVLNLRPPSSPPSNKPPTPYKPPLSLPPPPSTPANCTFNGNTVTHNSSVTAYQSSSVASGQTCQSQTRTCTNGTLSGSYTYGSCSVAVEQASLYDFGGMYGYGWGTSGAITYKNPATGADSCPSGYSATKLLDTSGKDYPLYYCSRPHTAGTDTLYDFGGMFGYGLSTSNTNVTYVNPATGAASCPSGYSPSQALYTATLDYPLYFCYRPHASGFTAINDFGGMGASAASCPSGYNGTQVFGTENLDTPIYFCSKAAAPAASCVFNGQTIAHGASVTAYQSATVATGQSCQSQTRTCTNGTLSGTFTNASCSVSDAKLGPYTPKFTSYITIQNGKFWDGTRTIRISGDTAAQAYLMHWAAHRASDSSSDPFVAYIDAALDKAKMMNQNVVRIFADPEIMVNAYARNYPSTYGGANRDTWLNKYYEGLDFALRKIEDKGLRAIVVLYHPWPTAGDSGGTYNYELLQLCKPSIAGDQAKSYEMFTDETCKQKYNDMVIKVITRANTYKNNQLNRDDKTILGWDLFNEPANFATDANRGQTWVIYNWVYWTAKGIKDYVQPKQLITTSLYAADMPGYASKYPNTYAVLGNQSNNVFEGKNPVTSMYDIFSIPYIDYADVHLYLSSTQQNLAGIWGALNANTGAVFLEEIDAVAASLGKPLIVSEFGVTSRTSPNNLSVGPWVEKDKTTLYNEMSTIINWAYHKNIDGIMPWGVQFDIDKLVAAHPGTWTSYRDQLYQADYNIIYVTDSALADQNSVLNMIRNYTTLFTQ